MKPVISITLPSVYPKALERALDNIEAATRCPYQVIVVSPFEVKADMDGGEFIWVQEEKSTGCNAAHMAAVKHATGEFITGWVDDHFYADGWDVVALRDFRDRERKFQKICGKDKPFELGLRHAWPTHVGTQWGLYYPYFPFMRLSDVKKVGWLTDEYRSGFADGDLAMRVWSAGGRCEWSSEPLVVVHSDDSRKNGVIFHPEDLDLFVERWGTKYGAGWDTTNIRGFNIDLTPETYPQLVENRSIYFNEPKFRDIALAGGWRP